MPNDRPSGRVLPLHGGVRRLRRPPTAPSAWPRHSREFAPVSALLVDSDRASVVPLAETARASGWAVRIAQSSEHALEILQGFMPDLAIVELVQPRMSGLLFGELMRADPIGKDLILIALTAMGDGARALAHRAGFSACLHKPVDAPLVCSWVEDRLRETRPRGAR